jgi:hypothetical protein
MGFAYEHQLEALKALAGDFNVYLRMRKPGDWYLSVSGVEVRQRHMLSSPTVSESSPMGAVGAMWTKLTELPDDEYLVVNAGSDKRFACRWNGFMWKTVEEEKS